METYPYTMEIPIIFGIVRQKGQAIVETPARAVIIVMMFIAPALC